jgi:arsenite methyltransferase
MLDINDPGLISVLDELSLWSAPFGLTLLENIEYRQGIKVLDIGYGTGFPLIELAQRLGKTSTVYGIDTWAGASERIDLKCKQYQIDNVCCINGSAENLPFETRFFDLVVSNNGINNIEDQPKAIREIARVCKPGAQFVFTVNLPATMKEFYSVFKKVLVKNHKVLEAGKINSHIAEKRKPIKFYVELLEHNNLQINNIVRSKFHYYFADGEALLNYFLFRLGFMESWKSILNVEDRKYIFEEIEKELNKVSLLNGKLSLTVPYVCFKCLKKITI